jgi:dolichyl-phosphate beta-glucosyltransferase
LDFRSVSVVIPAYNEGERVELSLYEITRYLEPKFPRFEIIVVDDGSGDDTVAKVKRVAETNPHIVLMSHSPNRGKGFAVRQGMLRAASDAVLFTDADLSTPVQEIEIALRELARGFPVVIASRRHPDSSIASRQSRVREIIGRIFNALVRLMIGLPYKDTQCGFKCFTRSAAKEVFGRARIDTFSFDVEVLLIAKMLGYAIKEIPVRWTNAPGSKVRPLRDALTILSELLILYRARLRGGSCS